MLKLVFVNIVTPKIFYLRGIKKGEIKN